MRMNTMPESKLLLGTLPAILSALLGFLAGGFVGSLVAGTNAGLAGGATVLLYGIVGFLFGMALAIIVALRLSNAQLRSALVGAGIRVVPLLLWFTYRVITNIPSQ